MDEDGQRDVGRWTVEGTKRDERRRSTGTDDKRTLLYGLSERILPDQTVILLFSRRRSSRLLSCLEFSISEETHYGEKDGNLKLTAFQNPFLLVTPQTFPSLPSVRHT